jgi:hypothetical protein
MCHHGGAAHSCSSFADLVIKTEWEVEAKLDLTSHPVFMTRSGANVTPIGQQNPTRTPKTVRFARKNRQKYQFLILLRKTDFLDAHFVTSCINSGMGPVYSGYSFVL